MINNHLENKISRQRLAIIITAITSVAAAILLAVMLVTHADPKLTKIEITSLPYKTEYIEKQTLDISGLKVKAYYGDEAVEVTDYTVDKTVLEYGDDTVKVSYKDKTASFAVSVLLKSIVSIEVTKMPSKTVYLEGSLFDPSGTEITAHYDNGESVMIDGWEYDRMNVLSPSDNAVTVSFGGKITTIPITVEQKRLQELYLDRLPNKLEYSEGEYFDFLGLELYAKHYNAPDERIYDWELDAIDPLTVDDTSVKISYTLHDVKKSVVIDITVAEAERISDEQKQLSALLALLPQVDRLGAEEIGALNYVISVMSVTELTEEQRVLKDELCAKRDELLTELPKEHDKEYNIAYEIGGGLEFEDINYGDNPVKINGDREFELKAAFSEIAAKQGYEFIGWSMDGKAVTSISNVNSDKTVYAIFMLTPTVELIFRDSDSNEELFIVNPLRTDNYDFEGENIKSVIMHVKDVLPIAYYSVDNKRIYGVDLTKGSSITVYVLTVSPRELHLPDGNIFTVEWNYKFVIGETTDEASDVARIGSVFYIPVGAEVTITATNANVDGIFLDGVSIGVEINATVTTAVFTMADGEYPASVTYTTKLSNITTLSFVGQNIHSVVYPSGWNGIMSDVDLKNLAFIFDEDNNTYLNIYNINNTDRYFDDLSSYVFGGDTVINVSRIRNGFSLTVKYINGKEVIDDIQGKQSLKAALSAFDVDAVCVLNTILDTSRLFSDESMTQPVTKDELLSVVVRRDITVYSDWESIDRPPSSPSFDPVDYENYSFVNTWSSIFTVGSDILSCELVLSADGCYSYKTFVNGSVSANADGVYRLNNDKVEIKSFVSAYEYDIFSSSDLNVNISFASDGLLIVEFVRLDGTKKTVFEQVLFCGPVRPVNYSAKSCIGNYEMGDIAIELFENGTATIYVDDYIVSAYFRIGEDGRVYLMENGTVGTGDITEILEEYGS